MRHLIRIVVGALYIGSLFLVGWVVWILLGYIAMWTGYTLKALVTIIAFVGIVIMVCYGLGYILTGR